MVSPDGVGRSPRGTFKAFPAGDVNRYGTVNSASTSAIMFAISYQADLDVNMDGWPATAGPSPNSDAGPTATPSATC